MVVDSAKCMLAVSLPDSVSDRRLSLLLSTFRRSHRSLYEVSAHVLSLVLSTLGSCLHILHHGEVNFIFKRGPQPNGCVNKILLLHCADRNKVVPTTIHVMFAGLILILSFFNYESP